MTQKDRQLQDLNLRAHRASDKISKFKSDSVTTWISCPRLERSPISLYTTTARGKVNSPRTMHISRFPGWIQSKYNMNSTASRSAWGFPAVSQPLSTNIWVMSCSCLFIPIRWRWVVNAVLRLHNEPTSGRNWARHASLAWASSSSLTFPTFSSSPWTRWYLLQLQALWSTVWTVRGICCIAVIYLSPISTSMWLCSVIEKMLVVLRDGRKLFGVLRSYDQFGLYRYRLSIAQWTCWRRSSRS